MRSRAQKGRKPFKTPRFGPVLEVRVGVRSDDGLQVCPIRFASAKGVESAMGKAQGGWLPVGERHVRVRLPAPEAPEERRRFAQKRGGAPALEAPKKKRLGL